MEAAFYEDEQVSAAEKEISSRRALVGRGEIRLDVGIGTHDDLVAPVVVG